MGVARLDASSRARISGKFGVNDESGTGSRCWIAARGVKPKV